MPSPRELDDYADAALIAILRLIVASRGSISSENGRLLTSERVESIDDAIREGQRLAFFEGDATPQGLVAAESYRRHRKAIDPLWALVESHGLTELRREAERRTQTRESNRSPHEAEKTMSIL